MGGSVVVVTIPHAAFERLFLFTLHLRLDKETLILTANDITLTALSWSIYST